MLKVIIVFLILVIFSLSVQAASPGDVVMNEVAWGGTAASSADEWIELFNNTNLDIDLTGWKLCEAGGATDIITLTSSITANGYYLIERTDDNTVSDISGDTVGSFGGYGLNSAGEYLVLKDSNGIVIDAVNCSSGWFAGSGSPGYYTMERIDPSGSGNDQWNWDDNNGVIRNGSDADGNSINGTPRAKNSIYQEGGPESQQKTERVLEVVSSPFYPHREGSMEPNRTIILYKVPDGSLRNLKVFDVTGRLVRTLINQEKGTGQSSVEWDGTNEQGEILPVGIYIVHIEAIDEDTGDKKEGKATAILGRELK